MCCVLRLHSLCIPQGGADDFEGGSQFFWKGTRGDVKIFHNRKGGGGCQFFSFILVYNEKATVIVFFF